MDDTDTIAAGEPAYAAAPHGTPWHLWAVGVLSLLWNAFGAYDYTMTNLRDPGYLAQFPAEMMPYIDGMPVWATTAWALGVWGSLAGSVLLLMRSRFAVHAFAISLAGLAVSALYQATIEMPASLRSPEMLVMNVIIWAALLLFLWYAVRMRQRGVLR
jgi:hypothetical protein